MQSVEELCIGTAILFFFEFILGFYSASSIVAEADNPLACSGLAVLRILQMPDGSWDNGAAQLRDGVDHIAGQAGMSGD